MDLKKQHLLVLFAAGLVAKGVVKQLFGTNASLLVLVAIALYYYKVKRESQTIYQDMVRLQRETANKLDVLERRNSNTNRTPSTDYHDGIEDVTTTTISSSSSIHPTHFTMNQKDRTLITDRMHQYSRKLSGSQRERRKFLRRNRRKRPDEMEPQDEEENLDERFINAVDDEEVVCMDKIPNQFVDKEQVTQLRQRFEKINKTVMKPLQEEKESNHHRKAQ